MEKIRVRTQKEYDVLIGYGLLNQCEKFLLQRKGRALLVADANVPRLFQEKFKQGLQQYGIQVKTMIVQGGENLKSFEAYQRLIKWMIEERIDREDVIYAMGGGTVTDLIGFVASTYKRGISTVLIPTTLIAAIDASVGGKTGINVGELKNVIGTFYQPSQVIVDIQTLDSLDDKTFSDGCAEVIKTAFLGDREMVELLRKDSLLENRKDKSYLCNIITRCVKVKATIVADDERDFSERRLLNFGHTFAHGIESMSQFQISHGSAVSLGMVLMTQFAVKEGLCDKSLIEILTKLLETHKLPTQCPYDIDILKSVLQHDKKIQGNELFVIVPIALGKCQILCENLKDFISKIG